MLLLSEQVKIEIRNQHTRQSGYQNAVGIQLQAQEAIKESQQSKERQAGSQSIDTVDEIHGIVNKDNGQHSERYT